MNPQAMQRALTTSMTNTADKLKDELTMRQKKYEIGKMCEVFTAAEHVEVTTNNAQFAGFIEGYLHAMQWVGGVLECAQAEEAHDLQRLRQLYEEFQALGDMGNAAAHDQALKVHGVIAAAPLPGYGMLVTSLEEWIKEQHTSRGVC